MSTTDSRVGDVMAPDVLGIVPSAPLEVALRMMVEAGTDAALVLRDGRLVGIVTGIDLLRLVATG